MKRIRYEVKQDLLGFLLISQTLLANTKPIRIILNTKDLKFFIVEDKAEKVLYEGSSKSIQMLKKDAKKVSKDFGVNYESEVRPKVLK